MKKQINNKYLQIKKLRIVFPDFILDNIDFSVAKGEILVLLGRSGSGKSTLINSIAGIGKIDSGKIILNNKEITNLEPEKRNIGMVFQNLALFKHMNVYENIAFGLKVRGKSKEFIEAKVSELLKIVDLSGFEKRKVFELSGGEQQRVALARTIAPEPELILFDEPLSALDESLRRHLRDKIKEIQRKIKFTAIYVTHDQEEAFEIGDRIGVMKKGKILQLDTADTIYNKPICSEVAKFLGVKNIFKAEVISKSNDSFKIEFHNIIVTCQKNPLIEKNNCLIMFRAESCLLSSRADIVNSFPVKITDWEIISGLIHFVVRFKDIDFQVTSFRSIWKDNFSQDKLYLNIPISSINIMEN